MKKIILYIISLPKTIYFNFKVFNFTIAIKLPIFIAYNTILKKIPKKGDVIIKSSQIGNIKIGFDQGSFFKGKNSNSYIDIKGKLILGKNCNFCRGIKIISSSNSTIDIGDNFYSNSDCIISSSKEIAIGNNCLLGWNVVIIDGDGHNIYQNNVIINESKEIFIEDDVWISAEVKILKGVNVKKNSVIALGSIVTKKYSESNVIIAGNPSKIVKKDIIWEK